MKIYRFFSRITTSSNRRLIVISLLLLLQLFVCCCNSLITSEPSILSSTSSSSMVTLTREPQLLSKLETKLLQLAGLKERPTIRRKKSSISSNSNSFNSDSSFSSNSDENSVYNSNDRYLKVPKHLIDLYEKSHGNLLETTNLYLPGRFTKNANTVRTFYPNEAVNDLTSKLHFTFTLNNIPVTEIITGAELHLSINSTSESLLSSSNCQLPLRILINDLTKKFKPNKEPIMYPIDTKLVKSFNKQRTLSFDVFPAISRWINTPKSNHGLILSIFSQNNEDQSFNGNINVLEECGLSLSEPILFTYSDDKLYNKKSTRSAKVLSRKYRAAQQQGQQRKGKGRGRGHKHKNRKRNLCAKHKMFVDFTDVGWNDWIVAPPGYHAHHCAGECPFPMADHLNATNHAVIQALVNSMNPQLVPPPCCVPTKYSSLSLLYTDSSDKIVLKNYNEMVVDSCGCS